MDQKKWPLVGQFRGPLTADIERAAISNGRSFSRLRFPR
jgi:hypothetical protein